MTKIKFIVGGKTTEVSYEPGDTILDSALRNHIEAPYSCMEGVCGTCLCLVEQGGVDSRVEVDSSEFMKNKYLTCQSKPKADSDLVVVNYDKA